MGLFEFMLKLTHPDKRNGYVETTAVFTGKYHKAVTGTVRSGIQYQEYLAYQIRYYANEKEYLKDYSFYPMPDPDPAELEGTELRIRYNKRKPYLFEAISES